MRYNNKHTLFLFSLFLFLFGCATTRPIQSTKSQSKSVIIKSDYKELTLGSIISKYKEEKYNHAVPNNNCPEICDRNGYFTKVIFLDSIRNIPEIKYVCMECYCQNRDEIYLLRHALKIEIKIQEENQTYWIPCFEEGKINKLLKTPQNDTINIFYQFVGSVKDENNHAEPVFIINDINI
jgi:hypothetical protein